MVAENVHRINPRSGRAEGSTYLIMPATEGVRCWWIVGDTLERGESAHKARNLRNRLSRRGMVEVGLDAVNVAMVAAISEGRL